MRLHFLLTFMHSEQFTSWISVHLETFPFPIFPEILPVLSHICVIIILTVHVYRYMLRSSGTTVCNRYASLNDEY